MAAHPMHSLGQGIGVRNSLRGWTVRHIVHVPSTHLSKLCPGCQDKATLELLTDKELLVKEKFKGGYSLTQAGFAAMNDCE